jgi:hypothetical protein
MKKAILFFAISATAILASCGAGEEKVEAPAADTVAVAVDTIAAVVDTVKVADSVEVK